MTRSHDPSEREAAWDGAEGFRPVWLERIHALLGTASAGKGAGEGDGAPPDFRSARFVFLRLLGLVSLIAFVSIWSQIHGLIGESGILPADDFLRRVSLYLSAQDAGHPFWRLPTLAWWLEGDLGLTLLCAVGTIGSAMLLCNVAPRWVIAPIWLCYLSICGVGQVFLGYQWDALLLEVLFFAFFLAPGGLFPRPARETPVPRAALWVLWLVLLKLMVLSGLVKLWSKDPSWASLSALDYHYWTQPIPNVVAYWVDRLPSALDAVSVASMFFIELVVPFFVFGPRRLRHLGALLLVVLQVLIGMTGTYGFFNLLTIALCVLLVDDATWARLTPKNLQRFLPTPLHERKRAVPRWRLAVSAVAVCFVLYLNTVVSLQRARVWKPEGLSASLMESIAPFRSLNGYGLFAVMTTERREIIVEGSHDGRTWQTYDFGWKPTDPDEPLRMTSFHMPRLDWQMWFAALGSCRDNGWFVALQRRLLEGEPRVTALLAEDPFEGGAPRYVRSLVYDYRFGEDTWWTRKAAGRYCPPMMLEEGRVLFVELDAAPSS